MINGDEFEARWMLIDVLHLESPRLIMVGDTDYGSVSARRRLSYWAGKLIYQRLREVVRAGENFTTVEVAKSRPMRIHMRPIRSPINGIVLAVLAIYCLEGQNVPTPPVIGALEWEIDRDSKVIRSHWDENMYKIYEPDGDRSELDSFNGDTDRWSNELVHFDDRAGMKLSVDEAIIAHNGERYVQNYRINANVGSDNQGFRWLEAHGYVVDDAAGSSLWLRAITFAKNLGNELVDVRFEALKAHEVLSSLLRLMDEQIVIAYDRERRMLFMASKTWVDYGLEPIKAGALVEHVHPEDIDSFSGRVALVENFPTEVVSAGLTRLKRSDGGYQEFEVSFVLLAAETAGARYVLCKLESVELTAR